MWVSKIVLNDIRSFEKETIELSKGINLLVGPNNSGKSTITHAVLVIQQGFSLTHEDIRVKKEKGMIELYFRDMGVENIIPKDIEKMVFTQQGDTTGKVIFLKGGNQVGFSHIIAIEPQNFIYPFLSKRKVTSYSEQINEQITNRISGTLENLYAKVDLVSNSELPAHKPYTQACKNILGFTVTCLQSPNGKKACYVIDNFTRINIDKMGEGVASILGLLVDLCIADNKLFIMEEPENDIHPKALKGLLELIANKSKTNQFIITTHSNVVVRYLGSETGTKIFNVSIRYGEDKVPTSRIKQIGNTREERQELLEELGYELNDMDLWEGWLFLEEASAEKIIRDYLIRWFAPSLQCKLKTFSARTADQVEVKFDNFNINFCYLNLQPVYKNKAWVIIDSGEKEKIIIEKLKSSYIPNGWNEIHFQQFNEHDFESYYPVNFKDKVKEVLSITDRQVRRQKKIALLNEVESWIKENEDKAKAEFEISAIDVIKRLREIDVELNKKKVS